MKAARQIYEHQTTGKTEEELKAFKEKLEFAFITNSTRDVGEPPKKKTPNARVNYAADIQRKSVCISAWAIDFALISLLGPDIVAHGH